jgi:hypothetical protein
MCCVGICRIEATEEHYARHVALVPACVPALTGWDENSELQACLKRDHARTAIATQADAQQAGGRRSRIAKRSKPCLRGRLSWNPRQRHAGKPEVRMVEYIEELGFYPEL